MTFMSRSNGHKSPDMIEINERENSRELETTTRSRSCNFKVISRIQHGFFQVL